ncbi:hypothetical protein [Legionella geestiana]|uniref:hypothetical protein n=1 Tax=Legionella geestiana TaxID=45065 RepID=UPI00048CD67D|nr:hypothetical protein [Legionella geestiana]QBS13530.1 hypothetical protein E4T54_11895 [Legionella geestiana]STX59190.1 Uncharacterised protein [Legionella geestiana]
MRALNPHDQNVLQEIEHDQIKMFALIELAEQKEKEHLWFDAMELYQEAQHLSFHTGDTLQVKIMNEPSDFENWHRLNKKIEQLKGR